MASTDLNIRLAVQGVQKGVSDLAAVDSRLAKIGATAKTASHSLDRPARAVGGLTAALGSSRLAVAAWGAALLYAGKACLDAQIQMQRLGQSYKAVFGAGASAQLQTVYEQADRVGLKFVETAEAAKSFFAAGQGTALAPHLNDIFRAVTDAGAALQLSTDDISGALTALGQMMSKGKVQAEELRGQLGERLPGAFQMAAKAMGMTTAELDKFMANGKLTAEDLLPKLARALEEKYGKAAEAAADTVQGAINRMETEWARFKASILDSGPVVFAVRFVTEQLKARNDAAAKAEENAGLDAELERRGVKPAGKSVEHFAHGGSWETIHYTEEQREVLRAEQRAALAREQAEVSAARAREAALAKAGTAVTAYLKDTAGSKEAALKEERDATLASLDAALEVYRQQGVAHENLTRQKLAVEEEYQRKLAALHSGNGGRGASSAAAGQNQQDRLAIEKALRECRDISAKEAEAQAQKEQKNLEVRADFYRDFARMSGDYAMSLEYQNQLIQQQAQDWIAAGVSVADVQARVELMRQEIARDPLSGLARSLRKFGADYGDLASQVENLTTQMGNTISNTLANAFMTGKFSAQDFFSSLVGMAAQAAGNYFIGQIFSGIGGFFGNSGATPSAHGNVFSGGNLSGYSNSVVSGPTFFSYGRHLTAFASGAGLMGEAGPEAIMPLTRMSGGDLGVKVDLSGLSGRGMTALSPRVIVNLHNQTGTPMEAEAQATPDGQGGFTLDVILVELERGLTARAKSGRSGFTGYLEKAYGLSRAGVMSRNRR